MVYRDQLSCLTQEECQIGQDEDEEAMDEDEDEEEVQVDCACKDLHTLADFGFSDE